MCLQLYFQMFPYAVHPYCTVCHLFPTLPKQFKINAFESILISPTAILYCTVLYYYCTVLYSDILYCTAQYTKGL